MSSWTARRRDADWFELFAENAVAVPSAATDRLGAIAREHGVWMVVGVSEREPGAGTIYNTLLYFSPEGTLVEKHRKLVPTGSERTVWGMGDGSTLRVVETPFGRLGGLICPGRTTCPWRGSTSTPRGSTSGWRPRSPAGTPGSRRCATWPARTGWTSWASTRSCTPTACAPTSRTATGSFPTPTSPTATHGSSPATP
ncbi:hypothetical protein ISU10_13005 [Nocardioides agariphilus]|uniref:CN hydrolase domain-containing protein n=1 Tax=Nocardioides agariphilus TaxID=433664 RepID=A0A930VPK4_9ACTN|nr:hypothetical protein [Nocardioides agariphilus]